MEHTSLHSNLPQKRRHKDHHAYPSTNPPPPSTPAAKRPKLSAASDTLLGNSNSIMGNSSTPRTIDLTRGSNFEPQKGAKRLTVNNLKAKSSQNVDDYYTKVWRDLDSAVTSIFNGEQTTSPLEVLCRGVEATCRRGRAHDLFVHLRDHSRSHMEKQLLPKIQAEVGAGSIGALSTVHTYWKVWHKQTASIKCPSKRI